MKSDYSNFLQILDDYIRSGLTKSEIIESIIKDSHGNITEEVVCSTIDQLESQYGLNYIKYLK